MRPFHSRTSSLQQTKEGWFAFWPIAVVWAGVGLAYANSFQNEFHFDDYHTIVDNPAIRSLGNVGRFFVDTTTFSVLPANRTYRPLVSTSLAVDYALGHGYSPFWFHLSTLFWFLLLVTLLYLMYRHVLEKTEPSPANRYVALTAAAWFGLHPAMAETVNYVIQRGDVYCTLGCVGALLLFARYPKLRKTGLYTLPLAFALLAKPTATAFPGLLFFYVFFFETTDQRGRAKTSLIAILPSIAVTGVMLCLQAAMTPKSFAPSTIPAWSYRLTEPYVWLRYFGELMLPLHLSVDSDLTPSPSLDGQALLGLSFAACLGASIWLSSRRRALYPIAFGLLWFLFTQLPTSLYPLSEVENDHRMFFSFPGLILAATWALWLVFRRVAVDPARVHLRPALLVVTVGILCAYGWGVHVRDEVWRSERSLWLDAVKKSPHNGRGLMNYGLVLMKSGAYPEALDYFNKALELTPNYPALEINLGVVHGAMGSQTAANQHFQRAINLAPDDDTTHAFYGRWLATQGRSSEAVSELRRAVDLNPQRPMQKEALEDVLGREALASTAQPAAAETIFTAPVDRSLIPAARDERSQEVASWINLSLEQYRKGQYPQAIKSARRALKLKSNSVEAYNNMGAAFARLQQWDAAVVAEEKALAIQPDFQLARNNLAWSESHMKKARVKEPR